MIRSDQSSPPVLDDPRARVESVFNDFSITDDYCNEPYVPTCNLTRAVRRATGMHPPAGVVQRFLDEEVEQSDTRRVTRAAFEYLCMTCEISSSNASESNLEVKKAARTIFKGRAVMSLREFRESLQQNGSTEVLTDTEFIKIVGEIEKLSDEPHKGSVSVNAVEQFLMTPARHSSDLHASTLHRKQSGTTSPAKHETGGSPPHPTGSHDAAASEVSSQHEAYGVVSNDSQLVAAHAVDPVGISMSIALSDVSRPPSRMNESPAVPHLAGDVRPPPQRLVAVDDAPSKSTATASTLPKNVSQEGRKQNTGCCTIS